MCTLIFPSKIWAKKCASYTAKYGSELNSIYNLNSPLPCKLIYSQTAGLRCGRPGVGGFILLTTPTGFKASGAGQCHEGEVSSPRRGALSWDKGGTSNVS